MKRCTTAKKSLAAILIITLLLGGLVAASAEVFSAIVTSESMPVYGEMALTRRLGALEKDTVVRIVGFSNSVAKISYRGYTGYAKVSDMKAVDEVAYKAVTNKAATVYETASTAARSVRVGAGTRVYALSLEDDWVRVEKNGYVGYMKLEDLDRAADDWTPIATEAPAATPAPEATPAPTEAAGAGVPGIVSDARVAVYQSNSTSSRLLGHMNRGQVVNVVRWDSQWAYIELQGHYGYCSVRSLARGTELPETSPEPTVVPTPSLDDAIPATVTDDSVAVYQTAGTGGRRLGTLKKGQQVNVVSWSGGWAYIELSGHYGFCKLSALTRTDRLIRVPDGYRTGGFTATVISPNARAYQSASTDAQSAKLSLGAEVSVYAYNGEWACFVQDSRLVYAKISWLSRESYDTVEGDGAATETLLKALLRYGYFDGVPSEKYNSAAITAIKRFQSACGLSQTGTANQALQRILYGGSAPSSSLLARTFSSGDSGDDVTRVQTRLYALGYLSKTGSLDGDYGKITTAAVKQFQSTNDLTSSGVANAETMKKLYSTSAKKLPSGVKPADVTTSTETTPYTGSGYLDSVPSGLESTVSSYSSDMSNAEKLEYVIYQAQSQLGKPYVYGAAGPSSYDCSGLTTYIFKKIGINLKRSAYAQGYDNTYPKIEGSANLQRGDLVFFDTISDSDASDHAGIYIGNGYFIHASSAGHRVVVSNLTGGYYVRAFSWGRRVLN